MREIKFRYWDFKNIYTQGYFRIDTYGIEHMYHPSDYRRVENYKLMQYTGLKDKNGVEIYEGDIITIDSVLDSILTTEVYYANGAFRYKHSDGSGSVMDMTTTTKVKGYESVTKTIKVIGNIYENKELSK